jgi:hypothetical protein
VVRVADRGQVRLGVDPEVGGPEAPHGDVVRCVREHVRETQVIVIPRHAANRIAPARPGAMTSFPGSARVPVTFGLVKPG